MMITVPTLWQCGPVDLSCVWLPHWLKVVFPPLLACAPLWHICCADTTACGINQKAGFFFFLNLLALANPSGTSCCDTEVVGGRMEGLWSIVVSQTSNSTEFLLMLNITFRLISYFFPPLDNILMNNFFYYCNVHMSTLKLQLFYQGNLSGTRSLATCTWEKLPLMAFCLNKNSYVPLVTYSMGMCWP